MPFTLALVGRPNVGKSTLFNRLVGKKLALVDDRPGVTRDRREGDARLADLAFKVIDTAGLEDAAEGSLTARMREQTEAAIRDADCVLFMIDARAGLTPDDRFFAELVRRSDTPVIIGANKAEGKAASAGIIDAYELGFGDPIGISAEHGDGMSDLYDVLQPMVDAADEEDAAAKVEAARIAALESGEPKAASGEDGEEEGDDPSRPIRIAIVGRPNAGKSTLINAMLDEERLLTGPEAGITRDSISIDWTWRDSEGHDRQVRLIDTAGLRKKSKVEDKLERLSAADTRHAIDFAEVVVLLLDATRGLEHQDLKIASMVLEEGRALIIAINKWDVAGKDAAEDASSLFNGIKGALDEGLSQVKGLPVLTVSARTGKGLDTLIKVAFEIRAAWSKRVPTALLNRWFDEALEKNPPPAPGGKRIKLRYITQAKTRPPGFVLFGTRLDDLPASYQRYLINGIRRDLGFDAVPVRLTLRSPKNPFKR